MATKQKILIVDDDNNIAELVALYLTKECFETKIVNDGEEALKQFHISVSYTHLDVYKRQGPGNPDLRISGRKPRLSYERRRYLRTVQCSAHLRYQHKPRGKVQVRNDPAPGYGDPTVPSW